jgi:integrase
MARPSTGTVQWFGDHWRARVTLADGSRPWIDLPRTLGRDDEAKAREKARELAVYAREHGMQRTTEGALAGDGETVREYAARWIAERERRGLRSVRDDRQRLNTHVMPLVGDLRVRGVTAKDARAVVAALDAKVSSGALAWRTALNTWGSFSKMMGDACGSKVEALRVRDDDPTSGVAAPDRGTERSKAYLYPSELLSLVSSERVPLRWRRIYALAVYTYCRAGELEALTAGDVDLERGVLHVHRATDRETGEARETKTKHARRLPVEPTLRPLLAVLCREAGEGGALVRMPPREDGAATLRKHLEAVGITRAELYADDATRTPITFHDLRATGITWRAVRGDEPLKIQRSAGHTDLNTTQRYIREAENLRAGFGDVFPELPRALLGADPGDGPHGGGERRSPDGTDASPTEARAAPPAPRSASADSPAPKLTGEKHKAPDGVPSNETSTGGGVLRESLTLSRPCVAIPTGLEPVLPT